MTDDRDTDPTDADIERRLAAVATEWWARIWAAVDALAEVSEISTVEGGQQIDTTLVDGVERAVYQMPYVVYDPEVLAIIDGLRGAKLLISFAWPKWDGIARYRGSDRLLDAPVADAVRMIAAVVRAERFTEGAIGSSIKDGTLPAALGRIRRWCMEHGRTSGGRPTT